MDDKLKVKTIKQILADYYDMSFGEDECEKHCGYLEALIDAVISILYMDAGGDEDDSVAESR